MYTWVVRESPQISATLRSFFPGWSRISWSFCLGIIHVANIQDEMIPYDSFLQQLGLTILLCHLSISGWSPIRCRWNPAAGPEQTMRLQVDLYCLGEATKQVPADSKLNQWTKVPVVIPGESNSITFSGCWHVRAGDRIFPSLERSLVSRDTRRRCLLGINRTERNRTERNSRCKLQGTNESDAHHWIFLRHSHMLVLHGFALSTASGNWVVNI